MKKIIKLRILQLLSFVATVTPLLVVIVINWNSYVTTLSDGIKISIGLVMALLFLLLKVLGKLKMPKRVLFYALVCAMSYFLYPLIEDIVLISGMCLLGEIIDLVLFQKPIKNLKDNIYIEKTADVTSTKVEEKVKNILDNYMGGRC